MKKFKEIMAAMLALLVIVAVMPATDAAASPVTYTIEDSTGTWSSGSAPSFSLSSGETQSINVKDRNSDGYHLDVKYVDKNDKQIGSTVNRGDFNSSLTVNLSYDEKEYYTSVKKLLTDNEYSNVPETINMSASAEIDGSKNVTLTIKLEVEPYVPSSGSASSSTPATHTHTWKYGTIFDATEDTDGLEGYYCSCGANKETTIIPSITAIYRNRYTQMDQAGKGEVITLKMGEWNTYSKEFMQHLISATERGVTVKLDYKYEKKNYVTTVPAGTTMDLAYDYYGPLFIQSLFETTKLN